MDFNQIPSQLRTPLAFMEIDNSRAITGLSVPGRKVLVMAQQLVGNRAVANALNLVPGIADAEALYGADSQIAAMFRIIKALNPYAETWGIGVADNGAGVAAVGNVSIVGPATAAGTLCLYIKGVRVLVGVADGDTAAEVATNLIAAINATPDLPVTAVVDGAHAYEVDITANFKGTGGNDLDLRLNYQTGDFTPAGLVVTLTAFAGGATNPDITAAIGNMSDTKWNTVIMGWNDATNITAMETELETRWGAMSQKAGRVYAGFRGILSAANTYGAARNSKQSCVIGTAIVPNAPWEWAAALGITCEGSLAIDAARPVQTLALTGLLPPKQEDAFIQSERNTLLYDGISTYYVEGGVCYIERAITTYQTNPLGAADPSYLDIETMETLDFFRVAVVQRILLKFPRYKLADDGTTFNAGQAIVTPAIMRAELIALFAELEAEGFVEDAAQFAQDLVVQRNGEDVTRLDILVSPNLVNQFRIAAIQAQFIL